MAMIKTESQIKEISKLADLLSDLLKKSLSWVVPGITTMELDQKIESEMEKLGVTGPCKGYHGFPCVSCISVNEQVTHGIPDERVLEEGDIVDIDLVIERDGFYADCSKTVAVGSISEDARKLIDVTEECLMLGIKAATPGNRIGDIGYAIQNHAESNGYSVVRDYTGHFIGLDMHENPAIPNFGVPGAGLILEPGMILCIEPMINQGRKAISNRGWVAKTRDGKLSSRCEHMVLITNDGNKILTDH